MKKSRTAIIAAVILGITMLSSCGGNKNETGKNVDFEVKTDGSYPIQTDKTITWWVSMHESVAANFSSLNETQFAKERIAQTGVNVEFIHPPMAQVTEKFNLMIASQDYPDIIETKWNGFAGGGPHAAIEDGVIIPLNNVIEKAAPNLNAYLSENNDVLKGVSTDEKEIFAFPFVRESDYLSTYFGPMFRKDYLDRAGLDVPETIQEWETALYAFKDMGVEIPLAVTLDNGKMKNSSPFLGAYGAMGDFYVEDGKVKFGPYDDAVEFTEFVKLMAKWYKDGILNPNFVNTKSDAQSALGISGKWGVIFASSGGSFGSWIPAIQKNNPDAEFVPAKYPVLNKGETPKFGQKNFKCDAGIAAISTQCEEIELAARLLDYAYSEKGYMLYNFGKEGESYQMIDGIPTYTEMITNPDVNGGKPMGQMIAKYARASYSAPMIQSENYMKQYAKLDVQKQAIDTWSDTKQTEYALPYVLMTAEENSEYSAIMADINTYRQEELYKFITGTESLDRLSDYFTTLKNMKIERAIEINQTAYERYLER